MTKCLHKITFGTACAMASLLSTAAQAAPELKCSAVHEEGGTMHVLDLGRGFFVERDYAGYKLGAMITAAPNGLQMSIVRVADGAELASFYGIVMPARQQTLHTADITLACSYEQDH